MSVPILKTQITIRVSANGFIVIYNSQEYIFTTVGALNAWIAATSVAG